MKCKVVTRSHRSSYKIIFILEVTDHRTKFSLYLYAPAQYTLSMFKISRVGTYIIVGIGSFKKILHRLVRLNYICGKRT